jgi:TfoX/Sxy family transcriptional regulator of competence genes
VAYSRELADRVREALAGRPSVREVKMFGGLAFMVNEAMVVCVMSDGDLLVRADPQQADDLLTARGARPAEMGAGRAMGKSWISVSHDAIAADEGLDFWLRVALEYNDTKTDAGRRERGRRARG